MPCHFRRMNYLAGRSARHLSSAQAKLSLYDYAARVMTAFLIVAASVVVASHTCSADEAEQRSQPKVDDNGAGASVPMLDVGGRPMVEINIDGKGPFPFILDTGATATVIDTGLAAELGF